MLANYIQIYINTIEKSKVKLHTIYIYSDHVMLTNQGSDDNSSIYLGSTYLEYGVIIHQFIALKKKKKIINLSLYRRKFNIKK